MSYKRIIQKFRRRFQCEKVRRYVNIILVIQEARKNERLDNTLSSVSDEIHHRALRCPPVCLAGSGLLAFRGLRPPSRSRPRDSCRGGPEVAEQRKVSIDESCAVRGRVGFRAAWPSRVIDSSEHTQSLAFGAASLHRRREWKTRHATISRCYLTTRMAWLEIEITRHELLSKHERTKNKNLILVIVSLISRSKRVINVSNYLYIAKKLYIDI